MAPVLGVSVLLAAYASPASFATLRRALASLPRLRALAWRAPPSEPPPVLPPAVAVRVLPP